MSTNGESEITDRNIASSQEAIFTAQRLQTEFDRKTYAAQRTSWGDAYQDAEKSYDKWLVTLSGGALGISMTFLKDIVHPPVHGAACLLIAWILFALSIVMVLVNLRICAGACLKFIGIMDRCFSQGKYRPDGKVWGRIRRQQEKLIHLKVTDILNYGSLGLFLLGVVLLAIFTGLNL